LDEVDSAVDVALHSNQPRQHVCFLLRQILMTNDNAIETIDVVCCLCGRRDRDLLFIGKDRLLGHPGNFPLQRCRHCGMVYQSPRPRDIQPYYEGSYMCYDGKLLKFKPILRRKRKFNPDPNVAFYGSSRAYCEIIHNYIPQPAGGKKVLDVGCASGDFILSAQALGWQVAGIEPNPIAAQNANDRLQHSAPNPVDVGFLTQESYPNERFDLVTLWHVIEHFDDPVETLRQVMRVLKPGGYCVIQTPRLGSIENRLFGKYWSGFDSPRHLWIFSFETLKLAVEKAGLTFVRSVGSNSFAQISLSAQFAFDELKLKTGDKVYRFLQKPFTSQIGASLTWLLIDWNSWASNLTFIVENSGDANK
jgi:2-polyprenyl-3-methyl-5-hydroxy-6-metoxy-1,4-benzoquinol methylase